MCSTPSSTKRPTSFHHVMRSGCFGAAPASPPPAGPPAPEAIAQDEPAAGVRDRVDSRRQGRAEIREAIEQLRGIGERVFAQRPVVVAEHEVVARERGLEEFPAKGRGAERAEGARGARERPMHEEEDARSPVRREGDAAEGGGPLPLSRIGPATGTPARRIRGGCLGWRRGDRSMVSRRARSLARSASRRAADSPRGLPASPAPRRRSGGAAADSASSRVSRSYWTRTPLGRTASATGNLRGQRLRVAAMYASRKRPQPVARAQSSFA